MLNRLIAVILLVTLVGANLSRFIIFAGFEANQKFIAANLCENKSRPWMHCNGHCYLMKKLKQTEDKEKKQERAEQKNRYQEVLPGEKLTLAVRISVFRITYPECLPQNTIQRSFAIFHPPQLV
ncbi:hypothetical protein [Pedobacter cryoconitis]|uniref:Uncharacterized protein n=1 Tax=Pedobacter cryoconitis TaxID=188932 RepID=A0A7X0J825_9SPHI|nr:hypothetical protein [Pedobacter cryoconitis]MBB6502374.1 hypothetical protein [Pedobacter cryoconitis]